MSFNLDRFKIQPVAFFRSQREEADYFLAFHKEKKQERYLLKIYTVKNSLQEDKVTNEVNMNLKAQGVSQNVIKIKGVTKSQSVDPTTQIKDKKIIILMQYASQNLRDVIQFKKVANLNQYFTSQELKFQMKNLIKIFADLQRDNVSHRRIELETIYFVNQNAPFLLGDFYHSKNLIGQMDSEIRTIDANEIINLRFPDKQSLEYHLNGKSELKANYYKMDVYTLGIVFCQIAALEIYENLVEFDQAVESAIKQIGERYGRNVKEFISLMLAPREERKDFIELEEIMDQILDNQNEQIADIRCSIFPIDKNNLTVISEDNLRDDFSSNSSINDLFQRDESSNNGHLYSYTQSNQQSLSNQLNIPNGVSMPVSTFDQFNSREDQMSQSQQVFEHRQNQDMQRALQNEILSGQLESNALSSQQNQVQTHSPQIYHQNQIYKQQQPQHKGQIKNQQQEKGKGYDQHLQISIHNSIPFQFPLSQLPPDSDQNLESNYFQTQATVPKPIIHDDFSADYLYRSTQIQNQIKSQLTYEELIKKAKKLSNVTWFEKKTIKVLNLIGRGKLSEVRGCETRERNCCIVKMYYKKTNNEVWEMIQSLNVFNKVQSNLVIKIEGYYINQIQDNDHESELWVIQKQKKYNLYTVQDRFNITFQQRISIAKKLTQTIIDLHSSNQPIAHGDIKPQNILLDLQLNPFLTDFVVCESMVGPSQLIKSRGFETGYSSPEQFNDMQFCKNSDIWSLGIIFQEFIVGSKVDVAVIKRFGLYDPQRQGCLDLVQDTTNESYRIITNIIKRMTQYNPDNRISLKTVMEELKALETSCSKRTQEYIQKNKVRQNIPTQPIFQQSPPTAISPVKQIGIPQFKNHQQPKKATAIRYQYQKN